jgi:hypothetical protein
MFGAGLIAAARIWDVAEESEETGELRQAQEQREESEREAAQRAEDETETRAHERRADRAAYLREKLDERAKSEREQG